MTSFSHCDRKLIHDTTVYAVEFIFRELADQCKILICHVESKHIF